MPRAQRFQQNALGAARALLIEITWTSPVMTSVGASISSENTLADPLIGVPGWHIGSGLDICVSVSSWPTCFASGFNILLFSRTPQQARRAAAARQVPTLSRDTPA
jgi:hypothetical protein